MLLSLPARIKRIKKGGKLSDKKETTLMDSVKEIVVKAFQIREICGRCYQVIASPKKNKIKKSASSYNIALVREMPNWLFLFK